MILRDWLRGYTRVTPEQVKRMDAGSAVIIHGADRYGQHYTIDAKVVYCGKRKVLAYWDAMGNRLTLPIREDERRAYTLPRGDGGWTR